MKGSTNAKTSMATKGKGSGRPRTVHIPVQQGKSRRAQVPVTGPGRKPSAHTGEPTRPVPKTYEEDIFGLKELERPSDGRWQISEIVTMAAVMVGIMSFSVALMLVGKVLFK